MDKKQIKKEQLTLISEKLATLEKGRLYVISRHEAKLQEIQEKIDRLKLEKELYAKLK